jgi:meso-butanediol dehydrogenase/(S,S)-butanediol dehydrogenase/diacetyl reductase
MGQSLRGKVAIVTGAGQGIGKAVVLRLAQEGADVIIAELNPETAEQVVQEIRSLDRRALAYPIDLSEVSEVAKMVEAVVTEFGRVDILVNNAGVMQTKPLLEMSERDWDRMMDVNQKGLFFCLQAVAAQMVRQVPEAVKQAGRSENSYGKIVNFSSISGRRGRSYAAHYAASKAAVISITQSAALALAPYGINVNAVAPGVVPTPMWDRLDAEKAELFGLEPGQAYQDFVDSLPLKRAATPEEIAGAVAFLCSADSDSITGQTLNVDGGYEMN